jgi:cytochrome b pre-mRNA-processing protein 3
MIFRLFGKDPRRLVIARLYERVATASRDPGLYLKLGIPDTVEGRFESLSLHVMLLLRTLRGRPSPADEVAADLADALFRDLDASLREMGIGDTTVPKRMKKLAEAFYGRARAYDGSLDAGDQTALAVTLGRNVQGSEAPAPALARYALAADLALKAQSLDALLQEGPHFPKPDAFTEGTP